MNELPSSPDHQPTSASTKETTPLTADVQTDRKKRPDKSKGRAVSLLAFACLVLALLLAANWWNSRTEIKKLRKEIAQRLQTGDHINQETKLIAKSIQESEKELLLKVNLLEGKQIEAQSQQLALEQMYEELAKNRDDWALAETEQVLSTASQQLELAGNVRGALIALQNADARLARSDHPQAPLIRRAIARDMDKLKLLPTVDLAGLALRLDSVIGQIDRMPLLVDEKPALAATEPKNAGPSKSVTADTAGVAPAAAGNGSADWLVRLKNGWQSWANEMWAEVRQLIRIRSVETPEALLLSPTEAYYARENLKLRLLNARLALLSRNESAFRSDLLAAQDTIGKYFDTRAKQTQTVQALLKQVQGSDLSIEMPNLSDSLTAVRSHQTKPQ